MQLAKEAGRYIAVCTFQERLIPKAAGFKWDGACWSTVDAAKAKALIDYASDGLRSELAGVAAPAPKGRQEPTLVRRDGRFVFLCEIEDKDIAKAAGFRFRKDDGVPEWYSTDKLAATKLIKYAADPGLRDELLGTVAAVEKALALSAATDADVDLPVPDGLAYLPYQKAGIAYALDLYRQRCNGVLIGDDMGLGKTIQAIGVCNAVPEFKKCLIVCPASLKINWRREFEKWSVRPVAVGIATSTNIPDADVVIVNYDICHRLASELQSVNWDLAIFDESHKLKNPKALRTIYTLGGTLKRKDEETGRQVSVKVPAIPAKFRALLTGTPIPNRVKELWTLVHAIAPDMWSKQNEFLFRYCNPTNNGWGWNFDGASHLEELNSKLRARVMVRRLKKEVLTELPPKIRQVVVLPAEGKAAALVANERRLYEERAERIAKLVAAAELAKAGADPAAYERAVEALRKGQKLAFEEMAKARHDTAVAKVPQVIEHLEDAIEASGKIICFAHHKDVVAPLMAHFGKAAVQVTGDTKMEDRQAAVDRFQSDPTCTLFVGNIQAAGVGLTLTASSHVVFAEGSWVPSDVSQAEDRAHRYGQRDTVLVQHLVFDESIDVTMADACIAKQKVADAALDDETDYDPTDSSGIEAVEERLARERALEEARRALSGEKGRMTVAEAEALVAAEKERAAQAAEEDGKRRAEAKQREHEARLARATTEAKSRADLVREAEKITADQIASVHDAVCYLASLDTDRAMAKNDAGYSKSDSYIGHALAAMPELTAMQACLGRALARRYHRQLSPDALARMGARAPKSTKA